MLPWRTKGKRKEIERLGRTSFGRQYADGAALGGLTGGPAQGEVSSSFSGAMMVATEAQREAAGLGRKGISSGWDFWQVREDGG